jgi:hypothetical protein
MSQESENRICQNSKFNNEYCEKNFVIEPDDFVFYDKIKVPPPTFCPTCRMQRRMIFRNENFLYKRNCTLCKDAIISMYDQNVNFPVYCYKCYKSDSWDALDFSQDYDFNINFFDQYKKLSNKIPRNALEGYQNENSPFSNYTWVSKNVYLSPTTMYSENVTNSFFITYSKDILDSSIIEKSNFCYNLIYGKNSSNIFFSKNVKSCIDSFFLFDCINCNNCFMSSNLRNKSNVFRNVQLTPEEYRNKLKEVNLSNFSLLKDLQKEYESLKNNSIVKFSNLEKSENATGDNISNSKNVVNCFDVSNCENVKYVAQAQFIKDSMDLYGAGDQGQFIYEVVNGGFHDSNVYFSSHSYEGMFNVIYTEFCFNSQNIFGCIGLKNKQYCILNKQYSKEEYFEMVEKIKKHMNEIPFVDKWNRIYKYGEFFPLEFSPFAYNESVVVNRFLLNKESVINAGYEWKVNKEKTPTVTVFCKDIPLEFNYENITVSNEIFECEGWSANCTKAFKIAIQEFEFYKRFKLPLPHICPICRFEDRFKKINPMKLWNRTCMKEGCTNEFETSYAPDRPEIIYCETCYQQEIY